MKKFIKEVYPYVIIIIVVVLIRSFIITPVRVDGDSMDKYLHDGQILFLYRLAKVDRFDIVVLKEPDNDEKIIKRVYGLPGDSIEIDDGKIYINDEVIKDEFAYGKTSDYEKTTLESDEYFVLGDNRLISKDSRTFGKVKKDDIKGVTTVRIFPFNKIKLI
ncbi:MAG: signal peptidase I [Bacilli bacterium]